MARPDRLFLSRLLGRLAWVVALCLLVTVALSRCGSDKKQDDDDYDPDPTATDTGTGTVPDAWDGTTDWSGSPFEVVEE